MLDLQTQLRLRLRPLKRLTKSDVIHRSHLKQIQYSELTDRELQICELITKGLRHRQIGKILQIAPCMVLIHKERIKKKLGLPDSNTFLRKYLVRFLKKK